jgi:hypothetical protein
MPYFPGKWFPKHEEQNTNRLFEASMLALLKLWRTITELKTANETFHEVFECFMEDAPEEMRTLVKKHRVFSQMF